MLGPSAWIRRRVLGAPVRTTRLEQHVEIGEMAVDRQARDPGLLRDRGDRRIRRPDRRVETSRRRGDPHAGLIDELSAAGASGMVVDFVERMCALDIDIA